MSGDTRRSRKRLFATVALAACLGAAPWPAVAAQKSRAAVIAEQFEFRWQLEGLSSWFARLLRLLPTSGDGVMSLTPDSDGALVVTFAATSDRAGPDEYWRYQTLVELETMRTLEVTDSLRFRKRERTKSYDLRDFEVLDVLSGLQVLRYDPPVRPESRTIWSSGKMYPVRVLVGPTQMRDVDGRPTEVRKFSIRGERVPGQRYWSAYADIWLTEDSRSLPVELFYKQSLGKLRLRLVDGSEVD